MHACVNCYNLSLDKFFISRHVKGINMLNFMSSINIGYIVSNRGTAQNMTNICQSIGYSIVLST